jgi:hypothetical protein
LLILKDVGRTRIVPMLGISQKTDETRGAANHAQT